MVSTVFEVVNLVSKFMDAGATTYQVVMTLKKQGSLTTKEKVDVAVKIIFCVLQTTEIGFSTANLIAPKKVQLLTEKHGLTANETKLILSSATGVGAIARTITHKVNTGVNSLEDILDIVGVVIFRLGEVTAQAALFENISEKNKEILECIGIGTTIVGTTKEIGFSGLHIYRKRSALYKSTRVFLSIFFSKPSKTEPKINVIEINDAENVVALEANSQQVALQLRSPERMKIIPSLLCGDAVLSKHICPITKRPIRFAIKPNLPSNNVVYERAALGKWIKDHPDGEHPPEWPENLDCLVKNSTTHQNIQKMINQRLTLLNSMYENIYNQDAEDLSNQASSSTDS